jgi:protein O-GlcNAc transferase
MPESITLSLVDGVRIVVPDSLDLITPYVLIEQQDWFEDEIRFLRRLLVPGHRVIDIGANYGIYALCMAKAVGAQGFVWAFEPSSSCAALLGQGIAANGFDHIIVERSAVSRECGTGLLALNDHSELNALIRTENAAHASESVSVVTLDECLRRYGWKDIDYLKVDAEGEEANILEGGRRFLAELSPLIQYEIKGSEGAHLELVGDFAALGYRSYRLVPGLGVLAPFDADSSPDGYLLNLFCCKPDRAAELAAKGFLLDYQAASSPSSDEVAEHLDSLTTGDDYTWRRALTLFPYGAQLATVWENAPLTEGSLAIDDAISCYVASRDDRLAPKDRFNALQASFHLLASTCERHPDHLRLATLARVAADYGARTVAVNALQQLAAAIMQSAPISLSEPFFAPGERFDSIPPREAMADWLLASVLEQLERLVAYSSFYTGNAARRRLELIGNLGFATPEMDRRLHLVKTRLGAVSAT